VRVPLQRKSVCVLNAMEVLFVLVPAGLYAIFGLTLVYKIRAARFEKRADRPFGEIYRERFEPEGIAFGLAEELWCEAAKTLRISAYKLRPTDRFDGELQHRLAWFPFVDLNDDFYWSAVSRLRKLKGENRLLEDSETLGDFVTAFCKLQQRVASESSRAK
jgi:hypothetical protein